MKLINKIKKSAGNPYLFFLFAIIVWLGVSYIIYKLILPKQERKSVAVKPVMEDTAFGGFNIWMEGTDGSVYYGREDNGIIYAYDQDRTYFQFSRENGGLVDQHGHFHSIDLEDDLYKQLRHKEYGGGL